jgi:hypothetical protein
MLKDTDLEFYYINNKKGIRIEAKKEDDVESASI